MNDDNFQSAYQRQARAEIDQIRESAKQADLEVAAVVGRAASTSGVVTVEVDSTGSLRHLRFANGVTRLRPDELASLIVKTVNAAEENAKAQIGAVTSSKPDNPHMANALEFLRVFTGEGPVGERHADRQSDPDPDVSWMEERGGSIFGEH